MPKNHTIVAVRLPVISADFKANAGAKFVRLEIDVLRVAAKRIVGRVLRLFESVAVVDVSFDCIAGCILVVTPRNVWILKKEQNFHIRRLPCRRCRPTSSCAGVHWQPRCSQTSCFTFGSGAQSTRRFGSVASATRGGESKARSSERSEVFGATRAAAGAAQQASARSASVRIFCLFALVVVAVVFVVVGRMR